MADEIRVRIATDISALQSGFADAQAAVEKASANMASAQLAFGKAAEQGSDQAKAAIAEYAAAVEAAQQKVDAINAQQSSFRFTTGAAVAEAPGGSASGVELQREVAAATLEQAAARQELSAVVSDSVKNQLDDAASLDAVSAAQQRLIAASEALATAKKNLAASADFDALAEDAESAGAVALSDAELQLSEATLAAKAAKTELNAAISQYAGRTDAEAIAVVANAQRVETETTEQLIAAKEALAAAREADIVAATEETAAVEGVAAANTSVGISARQSASAGIGILEGRLQSGNRAAAAFAATTLGLGPILQAAFPIIGALALGEVLVQIGTKLYDTITKADEAGQAISRAFGDASDKIQETTDQIILENSKLQDQIDKLEGHPNNGLQTALSEDVVAADKLQDALDGVVKKIDAIYARKDLQISFGASLLTGKAETGPVTEAASGIVNDAGAKAQSAKDQYDTQLGASNGDPAKVVAATKAYHEAIQKVIEEANGKLKVLLDENVSLQKKAEEALGQDPSKASLVDRLAIEIGSADSGQAADTADFSTRIADLQNAQGLLGKLSVQMQALEAQSPLRAKAGQLQGDKAGDSAANKASEEYLRGLERLLAQEESIYGKSANQTAAFWSEHVNDAKLAQRQEDEVVSKLLQAQEQLGKKEPAGDLFGKVHEEAKKNNAELKKDADEYQRILDSFPKGTEDLQKAQAKTATDQLAGQHEQNLGNLELGHAQEESPYNIGTESDAGKQLAELKKFHEAVQAENEDFLRKEIVIAQGARETDKAQELQNKLTEIQQKGELKRLADQDAILKQQLAGFEKVYAAITSDLNESINKLITSTQRPAQVFAQMFDQILAQLASFVEKWIENEVEMWARTLILQATGQAASKTLSLGQIAQAAATAAANTYASVSAVPIVGPVLAPPASAAAYASVLAFEAFEQGGIVSGAHGLPVPIIAHAGERVLSSPQTQNFERLVNQGGDGITNFNLNYQGQVNAFDRNGMRSTLKSHAEDILDIVKQGLKQGKLR